MAYEKTNWVNDSLPAINAENLNKIENGIVESNIFRNLFNINSIGDVKYTIATIIENSIKLTYGDGASGLIKFANYIKNKGKNFNISLKSETSNVRIIIIPRNASGEVLSNLTIDGYTYLSVYSAYYKDYSSSNVNFMINFSDVVDNFDIGLVAMNDPSQTFSDIQIEESTSATEYTPFAGYIVESGSNDNGSWIKYSDGTMICRNIFSIADVTFTEIATGINYSETQIITYPQKFIDNDVSVKVSCKSPNFAWAVNEISIASSFQFDILHSTNVTRDISCSYIAIGKWK